MIIKLNELKAKKAARGERVTLDEISEATGINRRTLDNLASGKQTEIRGDYIDALAAYFGVDPNGLIEVSQIELPLSLNLRPDRRGIPAGHQSKKKKQSVAAELRAKERAELPAPTPEQMQVEAERRAWLLEQAKERAHRSSGK